MTVLWGLTILALFALGAKAQKCDTTLNVTDGTITVDPSLTAEQSCMYTLQLADKSQGIYFTVEPQKLPVDVSLIFYNGSKGANSSITKLDAEIDNWLVVFSAGDNTNVEIKTGKNYKEKTLTLSIPFTQKDCKVNLNGSSGRLSSPAYLQNSNDVKCSYSIPPSSSAHSVGLSFESINIVKGVLHVKDGDKVIKNYTDGVKNAEDEILQNAVLEFTFSGNTTSTFQASYVPLNTDCSQVYQLENNKNLTITSPNYPSMYENNLDCRSIVHAPMGSVIYMEVADMMFADQYDHLVINDGDSRSSSALLLLNKATAQPGYFLLTSGESLWIHFGTDETMTARGFSLFIKPQVFGERMTESGRLELKAVENDTRKDASATNVYYQLASKFGEQITLTMNSSALAPAATLSFYDGLSPISPLLALLSADVPSYQVFTSQNNMLIVASGFLENGTLGKPYFIADFTSAPTPPNTKVSTGESDSFVLQGDSYPTKAVWLIQNPNNETIALRLSSLNIGPDSVVSVQQGMSESSLKLLETKQSATSLPVIYIKDDVRVSYMTKNHTNNSVTIDDSLADTQILMEASYRHIPDCSGAIGGVLKSPNYPDRYPSNARCMWTHTIPVNKTVHVFFSAFDLTQNHSVTITTETDVIVNKTVVNTTVVNYGEYQGNMIPGDLLANGQRLKVEFSSLLIGENDSMSVGQGFAATLQNLDAGVNKSVNEAGSITSPKLSVNSSYGVWILTVPYDGLDKDSVNIIEVDLRLSNYKKQSFNLSLRDGNSISSPEIEFALKNGKQKKILTRYNSLYIQFDKPAGEVPEGLGFKLDYSIYECPKSQQCKNGVCMHLEWKCNGMDNCGDASDEVGCACTAGPMAYSSTQLAIGIILSLIAGIILAIAVPACMKKIKERRGRSYGNLSEEPVI